jgi:predicted small secreted protein
MKNEEKMKKLVLMTAVLLGLAACNTIEGLGQDVSAGARAVDRAI